MKQFMLNMMTMMMSVMVPLVYIGGIMAVLTVILYMLAGCTGYKLPLWLSRGAMAFGISFWLLGNGIDTWRSSINQFWRPKTV